MRRGRPAGASAHREKQTRLCLTTGHLDCPLYEAAAGPTVRPIAMATAGARGPETYAVPDDDDGGDPRDLVDDEPDAIPLPPPPPARRPIPRTNPVVLDRGRTTPRMRFPGSSGSGSSASLLPPALRGRGIQVGLAGLIAVALIAVLFVRFASNGTPGASPSGSPRPSASVAATLRPSASTSSGAPTDAAVAPSETAAESVEPTPKPSKTASPKSYKVKSGDTLTSIAAKFGTTVAVLVKLNNIKNPKLLQVGQVLKLP